MNRISYKGEYSHKFWTKRFIVLKVIDLFYGSLLSFLNDIEFEEIEDKKK